MKDVSGKVAVITGGASGIGLGMAKAFGKAGMKLVIADIDEHTAGEAASELKRGGIDAIAVPTDVREVESLQRLRDRAIEQFGSVDVLCNNAGVMSWRRAIEADHAEWEWVISINLWGVIHGIEVFLPQMLQQGSEGHIVNTSSIAGVLPSGISSLYSTTKFAIVGLSETLRNELAETPVGVSVLCPGAVATRLRETSATTHPGTLNPVVADSSRSGLGSNATVRDPVEVGQMVLDAIIQNRPYIFTEPSLRDGCAARFESILGCFDALE